MERHHKFRIEVSYDDVAKVYFVSGSDIPGLCTEGETLDELQANIEALIPDLFELNKHLIDDGSSGRVPLEVITQKELSLAC